MTHILFALLLISVILSPLPARSDFVIDPDAPPEPIATSTPEGPPTPIDWVSEVEWGCDEGFGADGAPSTRCGLGRYRRLCSIGAGVPDCHVFFELPEAPTVLNVLFLPGIKGSRLYENDRKLWEPSGSEDVADLFLNDEGKSENTDVYAKTGDILSETFGQEFYTSFFNDLDSFEEESTFGENWTWEAASYDWRLSLADIVTLGVRDNDRIFYNQVNEVPYVEQLLRDLAAVSPTGKVTIVAHSNGGLVAKALMQHLGDEVEDLVDRIVFVGVPQNGAPRALAAALFGYGEALPFDACANWTGARLLCSLLVDRGTARMFGEHSPMTYHLLPSEAHFDATRDDGHPPAAFSGMTLYATERERYGVAIDTASELYDFALAIDGGRTKPAPGDLKNANVLSSSLIAYARDIHASLDTWTPPPGVSVYTIVGWGKYTLSGIQFYEKPGVLGLFGGKEAMYRPAFTEDGDGVVPVKSALMQTGDEYWVDLTHTNAGHADLLEIQDVRTYIRNILTENDSETPIYLTNSEPSSGDRRKIMFFLHSPLTLGLYDENGKYTGLEKNGEVTTDAQDVEYGELGEVKHLLAPAGHSYEVVMQGTAYGTFTLEILERVGNDVATTSSIVDVPTSPETVATLTVPAVTGDISDLRVDYDGDGTTDFSITPRLGEPVVVDESVVPNLPEPPNELPPSTPTPEPTFPSRRSSSNKKRDAKPLPFIEVPKAETTTPASVAKEPEPESHVSVSEQTKNVAPVLSRTQTASVYDASAGVPRKSVAVLALILLLLLLLVTRKRQKKVDSA